jgi:tetratricopeptide (TPR) repeat protein
MVIFVRWDHKQPDVYQPRPTGQVTYGGHIAAIFQRRCVPCHQPGQPGPFPLLTYQDVRKRAADIARVTAERIMPPWLPDQRGLQMMGERRLGTQELGLIQQWIAEGAPQGPAIASTPVIGTNEWQLGQPDLIVTMPQAYTVRAEGRDIYRNFVVPVPVTTRRYVKAIEFKPGNSRVVHHTFLKVDSTDESRRADAADAEVGFEGMNPNATTPGGHFLGWQPGRLAEVVPDGLAWPLEPGSDLILEMHLNPSGKAEAVQASVGFYFSDRTPTNTCYKVYLTSYLFEIPAGAQDYAVEDSYTLPVEVQALAILPHAHYLGKEMSAWATLPNGTRLDLLHIPQWDFNWQGSYRFAEPIDLPKGTRLQMRFTYDNSTNNLKNPHRPPKAVRYGSQSVDEMSELWLQVLSRNPGDFRVLKRDFEARMARLYEEHDRYDLARNPENPKFHNDLAMLLLAQGRLDEAGLHFRAAIQIQDDYEPAHYGLGLVLRRQNQAALAIVEFETSIRLNPANFKSHGNLGFIHLEQGEAQAARKHFEGALQINPNDPVAQEGLREALKVIRPGQ